MLSAITAEYCPPSAWNHVRDRAEYALASPFEIFWNSSANTRQTASRQVRTRACNINFGKAISLAKLLIDARWAKRVLFLCDRKELRKQAKNAFNDFVKEPIYVIGQANSVGKLDARIYIGIYQGLINDYESFDVGFFDLIIADESHRSIYNLYGDLFKYFDALQIGLTPAKSGICDRGCHDGFANQRHLGADWSPQP